MNDLPSFRNKNYYYGCTYKPFFIIKSNLIGQNLLSIPESEIDLIRRLIGENIEVTAIEKDYPMHRTLHPDPATEVQDHD